jgi:hypothetical protein
VECPHPPGPFSHLRSRSDRYAGRVARSGSTVLVVGLGDLGSAVLNALANSSRIDRLIGGTRTAEIGQAQTSQAALIACLAGGPRRVSFEHADVWDVAGTAGLLRRLDPEIVVMAAARQTWWRPPALEGSPEGKIMAALPYAVWLPLNLPLVRRLMEARRVAGSCATVVCLPYPDAIGPLLVPLGLAPDIGAGNVTEVSAKLAVLAAAEYSVRLRDVEVRLVLHHAVEKLAFGAFTVLGLDEEVDGEPPWYGAISVLGRPLPLAEVQHFLRLPYALVPGRGSHPFTAMATAHLVAALLSDRPVHTHAPAPGGLPGGYPVVLSRDGIATDLPPSIDLATAIILNEEAARWDGIERVEADGTLVYTSTAARATEHAFGFRMERVGPADHEAIGEEILMKRRATSH